MFKNKNLSSRFNYLGFFTIYYQFNTFTKSNFRAKGRRESWHSNYRKIKLGCSNIAVKCKKIKPCK